MKFLNMSDTGMIRFKRQKAEKEKRSYDLPVMGIILFLVLIPLQVASAQNYTESETIREVIRFTNSGQDGNTVKVYNIHGNITVEGYDGEEIRITAVKQIEADNQNELDRAGKELQLRIEEGNDRILVYVDAPFIHVKKRGDRISYNINDWDDHYDFLFDITIQVPRHIDLYASTINRGSVIVDNIHGRKLTVSNVNGKIELKQVSSLTEARTVNGDITASYLESPTGNSSYKTINGTIEVMYPDNLSADIRFKSLHGDLYTDFPNIHRLRNQVETEKTSRGGETTYRIDKYSPLRIGEGGPEFSFEVLNGNVYVKRIKS